MKKLISFAVAVLMLLSIAVPVTFAADPTVAGTANDVGSVVGLTVDGAEVTSSADYIAKMGYETNSAWKAIDSYDDFAQMASGGNFYLTQNIDFTGVKKDAAGNLVTEGENLKDLDFVVIVKKAATIDGCGFSLLNLNITFTIFDLQGGSLTANNLTVGSAEKHAIVNCLGSGASAFARPHSGNLVANNICIWADITGVSNVAGFASYFGYNNSATITNSEMNGSITYTGTTVSDRVAGFAARSQAGGVTIENCVNNADITGLCCVGGIVSPWNYANRCSIVGCTNNGDIVYQQKADAITGGIYTDGWLKLEGNVNTGNMTLVADGVSTTTCPDGKVITVYADKTVTDYKDGRVETVYKDGTKETVLSAADSAPNAFIQMTEGDTQNIRFILAMSEAEYTAAAENMEFKISFKMTDDKVYSKKFNEIVMLRSAEVDDETINAADGVVFCGVIVTDVVSAEWTKCGISYGGNTWAYTK